MFGTTTTGEESTPTPTNKNDNTAALGDTSTVTERTENHTLVGHNNNNKHPNNNNCKPIQVSSFSIETTAAAATSSDEDDSSCSNFSMDPILHRRLPLVEQWGRLGRYWRHSSTNSYRNWYDTVEDEMEITTNRDYSTSFGRSLYHPKLLFGMLFFFIFSLLAIYVPTKPKETKHNIIVRSYKGSPRYTCPDRTKQQQSDALSVRSVIPNFQNTSQYMQQLWNTDGTIQDNYIQSFRNLPFRDWNRTYQQVKDSFVQWKASRYVPNLKTGNRIYELGCGIGLGLYLTLEILQEHSHLHDLHVDGSDRDTAAANTANVLLDHLLSTLTMLGRRGIVCAANPTQLDLIPPDTYDLVYASHITPIPDPYHVLSSPMSHGNDTDLYIYNNTQVLERQYEICNTMQHDWKSVALHQMTQERIQDGYGQWVKTMIRIAKAGAPVLIEYVRESYCDNTMVPPIDVGGLPYTYWSAPTTLEQYGWDIDPDSIEIESVTDTIFPGQHYHVFMRKNKHSNFF